MRKKLLLLILILFIPFMVYAEELPREGVTYFIEYPDGREDYTESYDEAVNVGEELIAEATTNSNGEVILNGWNREGTLRIVQEVPDGYSTQARELLVDLANSDSAVFTNYRGLINPNTGRNAVLFLGIGVLAFILVLYIIRKAKVQSVTTVLLIMLLLVGSSLVKAEEDQFIIRIKDSNGKGLSNVRVKIYSTPKVEAVPAIKFSANGGEFADGTNLIYYRIPVNECDNGVCYPEDFLHLLTEDDSQWLSFNTGNSVREGYSLIGSAVSKLGKTSGPLENGMTFNNTWEEDSSLHIYTLFGNGGELNKFGRKLTSLKGTYQEYFTSDLISIGDFIKNNSFYAGIDNNSDCSHYSYGLKYAKTINFLDANAYLCWNDAPDGIYLYFSDDNYIVYRGNLDMCFVHSKEEYAEERDALTLTLASKKITDANHNVSANNTLLFSNLSDINAFSIKYIPNDPITRLKVVDQGNVIVDLLDTDLNALDDRESIYYTVKEESINKIEPLYEMFQTCYFDDDGR